MAKIKNVKFILIGLAFIALAVFILPNQMTKEERTIIQGKWDIIPQAIENNLEIHLIEEEDFDYTQKDVFAVAQEIKARTNTPEEAIRDTLTFVVRNVRYSSKISINYCFSEKASDTLLTGTGDCVSMSRLVTALLRAQGIPARTVGGCLASSKRCAPLFAVIPGIEAQTTELVEGDFKKRGFLHEWVEIWTPDEGWRTAEATSGQLFPTTCNAYTFFSYDSNPRNRCVINDNTFWSLCKSS